MSKKIIIAIGVVIIIATIVSAIWLYFQKQGTSAIPLTLEQKKEILKSLSASATGTPISLKEKQKILDSLSAPIPKSPGGAATPILQMSDEEKQKILKTL